MTSKWSSWLPWALGAGMAVLAGALGGLLYYQHLKLQQSHARIADILAEIPEHRLTDEALRQEIESVNLQAMARLLRLEREHSFAQQVIQEFSAGIGFIEGTYSFVEVRSGKELRFEGLSPDGSPLRDEAGRLLVTTGGGGPVVRRSYTGTGFLAAPGRVLTNRHIARPWEVEEQAQQLIQEGLRPHLDILRAYFPGYPIPFSLQVMSLSDSIDVALLAFDPRGAELPVLPLDWEGTGATRGEPVVVLGYPAGVKGLLAKADPKTLEEILGGRRLGFQELIKEIARRGLIRPITTQGILGDVMPRNFIYDAMTFGGGSGGPIFNREGKVIGINYATLQEFEGSNFGLPIRFGIALLRQEERAP